MSDTTESQGRRGPRAEDLERYEPPRIDALGSFTELTGGTFVDFPQDSGSLSVD
jgi:hypothetical protein